MKPRVKGEHVILLWEQIKELVNGASYIEVYKEHEFYKGRKWRGDFGILTERDRWLIEIDGGIWSGGRHVTGKGFTRDLDKLNHAALMDYKVLRFTPQQVLRGEAIAFIRRALHVRQKEKER